MYRWLTPAIFLTLLFGCASRQPAEVTPPPAPIAAEPKPAPAPPTAKVTIRMVKSADGLIDGEIVGIPAPASKFAKLKIGMTLLQVESLIGQPSNTNSRVTGRQFQPFYAGGDTLRKETFYKSEGQLTFSNTQPDMAADTLIRIIVDPDSSGIH